MNDFDLINELKKLVDTWETYHNFHNPSSYHNAAAGDLNLFIEEFGG